MKPKVVATGFIGVDLTPGVYNWCACGQSKSQPFCDGSHQGTTFTPRKLEVKEAGRYKLCQCKHTARQDGVCDGSHNSL